jgi:hypothetical protein
MMEHSIYSRHKGLLSTILISAASLYGLANSTPANASFWPQIEDFACLADYSEKDLTCAAKDIRVSEVTNITNLDGTTPVECVLGTDVTFKADVTILTTANERYGYAVWLPEGAWSAEDRNTDNTCSVLVGKTDGPGIDIDGDNCADISKASGFSPIHVYEDEVITLYCRDEDNSGKAEFDYCTSWSQQEYGLCDGENEMPTPAGSPSKCRCESFDIDVFIKPDPPEMTKSLIGSNTSTEPGGEYTFSLSFTNDSKTSIFLDSLDDKVDVRNEDGLYEYTLDLWGPTEVVTSATADGVYLTSSTCSQPSNGGEIPSTTPYGCQFTVHIVDRDLPDTQDPQIYDDVVLAYFLDAKGSPVTDGETCPTGVGGSDGQFCTNVQTVQVTNLAPAISVTKTPDKDEVKEPGESVEFTIEVTNSKPANEDWDDPVQVYSLTDSDFGDLDGKGTCDLTSPNASLSPQESYTCSFSEVISGDYPTDPHMNTVTAVARDNENDDATAMATASVDIVDVPSNINLVKTAGDAADGATYEVPETGDSANTEPVDFTFVFSVDGSSVDNVEFDKLEDVVDGQMTDLTDLCLIDFAKGAVVDPPAPLSAKYTLAPGESARCIITLELTGDAGDLYTNLATIFGTDDDGEAKQASDPADVLFVDVPLQITPKFALKARVFVRIPNNGVDNIELSSIKLKNLPLADGAGIQDKFQILDESALGYNYGTSTSLPFCKIGTILVGETYECAFTIKLFSGFTGHGDVAEFFSGAEGLIGEFTDGDGGSPVTTTLGLSFQTDEP